MRCIFILAIIASCNLAIQSRAAEAQKGLAYYTDVHGAAALVRCLHAMSELDPKYREPRNAAVNWMLRQMHDFPGAGRTWLQNPSAPRGHKSFHSTVTPSANFNARTLMDIYAETKDARLLAAVKEHIGWLKTTAVKRQKKTGPAYAWSGRHSIDRRPNMKNRKFLLISGNSRGFGNILDTLAEYHRLSGDKSVLPLLEGGARFGYLISKKSDGRNSLNSPEKRRGIEPANGSKLTAANEHIHWVRADKSAVAGFCRGSTGNIFALQSAQQQVPGAKLTTERTIEDAINAGLRQIIAEARGWNRGYTWENMNGQPGARNIGLGRGVSGIAMTLWRGYEMNRNSGNQKMARQCRETAEGVIRGMLQSVESLNPAQPLTEHVLINAKADRTGKLNETIGYCSGIAGIHFWLFAYADAVRADDPKLARRCEEATRIVARRLINTAFVVEGNYAWKNHNPKFGGEKVVNMALDHGQTGVVLALAEIAARLKDPAIIKAAHKAAGFVLAQTVKDGDGIKMPFLVKITPEAKPLVPRK